MTGILSSISGYFSKSLILGTVLPVLVFMVLGSLFLMPLLPSDLPFFSSLEGIDKQWKLVAASFIAIVLSGFIYNLNIPILRCYEGYPWRKSWIGEWLTSRRKNRFDAASDRLSAMRAVRRLMEQSVEGFAPNTQWIQDFFSDWHGLGSPLQETQSSVSGSLDQWKDILDTLIVQYSAYRREFKSGYPDERTFILPTRLGNVIRSFEYYSTREYGIDSIVMWQRLVAVIPKDFAVSIDDTKTTFDFMLNCSVLSLLLAVSIFAAGILAPARLIAVTTVPYWLIEVLVFSFLFYFFYRLSINRVSAWGEMVKSAFDLYRWELLKALGYQDKPVGRDQERKLWGEIGRQMLFGDRFDKVKQPYATAPNAYPSVDNAPPKRGIDIAKGASRYSWSDVVTYYLRIHNKEAEKATKVVVTDLLGTEWIYEWGSAQLNGAPARVSGTNPYQFEVGDLDPNQEAVLKYNAIASKRE